MKYQISVSSNFWKSAKSLRKKYTKEEYLQIVTELRESMLLLAYDGKLPQEFLDHPLKRTPYIGFNEYHIYDDDVLVIYSKNKSTLNFFKVMDHTGFKNITINELLSKYTVPITTH